MFCLTQFLGQIQVELVELNPSQTSQLLKAVEYLFFDLNCRNYEKLSNKVQSNIAPAPTKIADPINFSQSPSRIDPECPVLSITAHPVIFF